MPVFSQFLLCLCFAIPALQENNHPESRLPDGRSDTVVSSQTDVDHVVVPQQTHQCYLADSTWSTPQRRQLSGKWQLAWDDRIDMELDQEHQVCSIEFSEIDRVISGEFIGPVAGTERTAIITGRVEGDSAVQILIFQQREEDYLCSYQAIDNGGQIQGVWHDTRNRSGNFTLLKYQ